MNKTRLRIRFSKQGDLRWISHRDLARVWERLLRRAKLEMAFSEGFHPKPRISFPSALALGIEALEEIVELEIVGEFSLDEIRNNIVDQMPEGMQLISLESPEYALGKAKVAAATYQIQTPADRIEATKSNIEKLLAEPLIRVDREKRTVEVQTSDPNFDLHLEGDLCVFSIPHDPQGSLRPSELLSAIGLEDLLEQGQVLQRRKVHMIEPEVKPQPQ